MVAFAENKISPADVVDAVNRRLRKTISDGGLPINIPNGTIDCIWFGWQAMEERNPFGGTGSTDTPIRQYVWGTYIDECLQINLLQAAGPQSLPAGYYYLLQDTLYRSMALTNSAGSVVEAYDTDAYGNTLIFTGPGADGTWFTDDDVQSNYGANSIIYCGYRYDPESENYYVRNRYYAPALGRWLTRDPIGVKGGTNLYAYVASSPVGKVDAWGLATYQDSLGSGVIGAQIRVNAVAKVFTPLYSYGPIVGKFKLKVSFSYNPSGGLPKVVTDQGSVASAGGWGGATAGGSAVIGPNPVEYDGHKGYLVKWNPLLDRSTPFWAHFGIAAQDAVAGGIAGAAVGAVTGPGDAVSTAIGVLVGGLGGFFGSFFAGSVETAEDSPAYTIRISGTWFVWQDCKAKTVHIIETAGAVEATSKTPSPIVDIGVEKQ
jgi:RHS repeat-associated protein